MSISGLAGILLKLPIHAYRYTLKAFFGWHCRHLPTCSEYALEAIDRHGPWRGFWLMISRLSRCHPWGTSGFDPVPTDMGCQHTFTPWRYGRWAWRLGCGCEANACQSETPRHE